MSSCLLVYVNLCVYVLWTIKVWVFFVNYKCLNFVGVLLCWFWNVCNFVLFYFKILVYAFYVCDISVVELCALDCFALDFNRLFFLFPFSFCFWTLNVVLFVFESVCFQFVAFEVYVVDLHVCKYMCICVVNYRCLNFVGFLLCWS